MVYLLKTEVKNHVWRCEHTFQHETKAVSFWSEIELRNLGDRGTNILGIDLKFEYNKRDYTLKMSNQEQVIEGDLIRWIRPHETIKTLQTSFTKFEDKPKSQIECLFTVYHTHGAEKIRAKSQKIDKTHEEIQF